MPHRAPVKVSVLMTAYRVAPYIAEAIESVLAQRGAPFELLIGCDPSPDGTWGAIQRYRHDPRVRAWRFRRRRTIGAVRNWLIARAQGRYLSVCDPDDRMLPGNLATLVRALDRDRRAAVACGDSLLYNRRRPSARRLQVKLLGPEDGWDLVHGILGFRHGSVMRRDLVLQAGGYRENVPLAEDFDLLLRLAERGGRFIALRGRPLYRWRRRPDSATHRQRAEVHRACLTAILRDAIRRRYGYRVPW